MEDVKRKKASQTKNIIIRCSPEQHDKIFLNASLNKLNASQYILAKALNEEIRSPEEHEELFKLIQLKADLARLGNLFKLCIDKPEFQSELLQNTLNDIRSVAARIGTYLEKRIR